MNDGLSVADVFAMTRNGDGSGGYGNGAWDNPFIYLVWLALLGGGGLWGNRGGFGGGGGGTGSCGCTPSCSDLYAGFNNQDVMGQLRGITNGICDGFYAINTGLLQGFNGVGSGLANLGYQMGQGFCGVDKGILNSNFVNQAGFNTLGNQLAQCCCDLKSTLASGFCDTNHVISTSTRDIIENQNNGTRAILDFLTQDKISSLTAENQALKFAASQSAQNAFIIANQEAQTAELIRRLGRDCPIPAYVVPNPNCCYGNAWGTAYGSGCGCGCA